MSHFVSAFCLTLSDPQTLPTPLFTRLSPHSNLIQPFPHFVLPPLQMKTLIDRMNAMYPLDYKFRDVYLLTTAAENEEETPKRAETGLTGWIDCYPKSRLAGTLFCGGVNEAREIEGNSKLQEAFEMGKRV